MCEYFIAVSKTLNVFKSSASLILSSSNVFSIVFSVKRNQESLTSAICPSSTDSTIVKIDSPLPPLKRFVFFSGDLVKLCTNNLISGTQS